MNRKRYDACSFYLEQGFVEPWGELGDAKLWPSATCVLAPAASSPPGLSFALPGTELLVPCPRIIALPEVYQRFYTRAVPPASQPTINGYRTCIRTFKK